ncbi:MAG: hypothetical protein K9K38_11460 [Rhodoferax sp.]|jgi:hypothetical protein|nr:hypothetical protein [Rhodoferax sp.]
MNKTYPDTGHDDGHDERARVTLPRLSDEAVIELHDFIHQLLDRFEASYGAQIDRFYEALWEDSRDDTLDVRMDWPL